MSNPNRKRPSDRVSFSHRALAQDDTAWSGSGLRDFIPLPAAHDSNPASAADRLACYLLRIAHLSFDVKTVNRWAAECNCSVESLRARCRVCGVSPKAAVDLGRLLRFVLQADASSSDPSFWFDVSDQRGLQELLGRGGIVLGQGLLVPSVTMFLEQQRLIAQHSAVIKALKERVQRARAVEPVARERGAR